VDDRREDLVQRLERRFLVGVGLALPEAPSRATQIPVGQILVEVLEALDEAMHREVLERMPRMPDQAMHATQDPAVQFGALREWERLLGRAPRVHRRIRDEEAIAVPEREQLAAHFAV
jgi:hypothetical protein